MNRRKTTRGLNTDQVKNLNWAWHHARKIGLPLNTLVTFRPLGHDTLAGEELAVLFSKIRNKIGVYARQKGFPPTFAWSREVNPDGSGEHLHVIAHIPARWREDFERTALRWLPGPGETDVRRAHYGIIKTRDGKQHSIISYISKQMIQQAWWRRGIRRERGGPILGKRGGVSQNIDWKARSAFPSPTKTPHRSVPA